VEKSVSAARWSRERANEWYARQPWLVGCNFVPSTAVNQLEMWQPETFDATSIDRELGWAAQLGMNTVRVFLHDLLWEADAPGFVRQIDRFLEIAARHRIRTLFVLFDDCWHGNPRLGEQAPPVPGIHNSRWVQSPGADVVADRARWPRLEAYVRGVIGRFASDDRVLAWDLYNEPGNAFLGVLSQRGVRRHLRLAGLLVRLAVRNGSLPLVEQAFAWARAAQPQQPLTVGVWGFSRSLDRFVVQHADVLSFHHYRNARSLRRKIRFLASFGRPLLCTEFMARTAGSRFETHLPVFREDRVGCYCWGLVAGKTQTIYRWRDAGGAGEPPVWFHDVLRRDGTPYREEEADLLRALTESAPRRDG
jgi:hypothetical protein